MTSQWGGYIGYNLSTYIIPLYPRGYSISINIPSYPQLVGSILAPYVTRLPSLERGSRASGSTQGRCSQPWHVLCRGKTTVGQQFLTNELSQCTYKIHIKIPASKEPMDDVSVLFSWYLSTHILATVWLHCIHLPIWSSDWTYSNTPDLYPWLIQLHLVPVLTCNQATHANMPQSLVTLFRGWGSESSGESPGMIGDTMTKQPVHYIAWNCQNLQKSGPIST